MVQEIATLSVEELMELSGDSFPLQEATCIAKTARFVSEQVQARSEAPVSRPGRRREQCCCQALSGG